MARNRVAAAAAAREAAAAAEFGACARAQHPHPNVPPGTTLALVEGGGADAHGRERFVLIWCSPAQGLTPCGHRAQQFFAVLDHYTRAAATRGERFVVRRVDG